MNLGTEDKKKLAILGVTGVLALGAVFYMYSELFGGATAPATNTAAVASTSPVAAPAPRVGTAGSSAQGAGASQPPGYVVGAQRQGTAKASATLDPTLKMGPMLVTEALVYTGTGRNIFSLTSAPVLAAIPKAMAPARPKGPVTPVVSQPQGPPPPPPIDLKFFGTATSGNGRRQAFLLHGEDVFLASAGDIVQRRYRIVSIEANSVVIEDMTNNRKETLPLLSN